MNVSSASGSSGHSRGELRQLFSFFALPRLVLRVTLSAMLRRVFLLGLVAAALAGVVLAGVAADGHARALDSVFDGTWQTTRGPMVLRSSSTVVDWGEYGDNPIGRVCGVHVFSSDTSTLTLSGLWYEGGPVYTPASDIECGNIHGSPWGRFYFKISSDGTSFTGGYETTGDGLPIGNPSGWPAWNGTKSGSGGGSTGGKTQSKLATASTPFGTPTTGTVALGGVVDIPSPSLPASTTEVDESAQFSDADITQLAAALKLAIAAYNRSRLLQALSYYCLVFVPNGDSYSLGLNDFAAVPGACDKFAASILARSKTGKYRLLSASSSGCAVAYVPFWKGGTRVSTQMHNAALAAARSEVQASCTATQSSRLMFKVAARGRTTLNQVFGRSVQAGIGANAKTATTAQLTVTWARPRVRVTPGSGSKAKAGHYTGQTSESKSVSFDVSADSANVTNLSVAGIVTCSDRTRWTWTMSSSSNKPISAARAFTHSYTGALTLSGSSIANINVNYTLNGTLTTSGTASGTFQISHITWDQNGTHYDCTGTQATWTATLG
jgi:hypothetical protein